MKYDTYVGFNAEDADLSSLIDSRGAFRTASLFLETCQQPDKFPPLYTLRNREYNNLPSAYLIYMHSVDEYEAAMKLVGTMTHWRKLLLAKWFIEGPSPFVEGLTQWRLDMAMRDASLAKKSLVKSAQKGDTSSARKLLDISETAPKNPVGRPPTRQQQKEAEREAEKTAEELELEELHKKVIGDG